MKSSRLLTTALLAAAIGASIAVFLVDTIAMPQPTTSPGVRVPFLHGLFGGQSAARSELASLERADEWLEFAAPDGVGPAR